MSDTKPKPAANADADAGNDEPLDHASLIDAIKDSVGRPELLGNVAKANELLEAAGQPPLEFGARVRIKEVKMRAVAAVESCDPERQPKKEKDEIPPNKLGGRLPKGYKGTERRLKHTGNGRVFVWTAALAAHPNTIEISKEEADKILAKQAGNQKKAAEG